MFARIHRLFEVRLIQIQRSSTKPKSIIFPHNLTTYDNLTLKAKPKFNYRKFWLRFGYITGLIGLGGGLWFTFSPNNRKLLLEDLPKLFAEPSRVKLLPDAIPSPYQPPYTLILELTDVIVHPTWSYQTGWRFQKRPYLNYLLETLSGLFEIVIFTAEPGLMAFPLIEAVDPNNRISYTLVRDSTHFSNGEHVKNLTGLNRDLRKVVVVDWKQNGVRFQPENQLKVKRWLGDDADKGLVDLGCFLKVLGESEVEDVRGVLRFYSQFEDPLGAFRERVEQAEKEKKVAMQQRRPFGWLKGFIY